MTRAIKSARTTGRQTPSNPPAMGTTRIPSRRWPRLALMVTVNSTCMPTKMSSVAIES